MPDDFCLLLDPVPGERPAWPQAVIVSTGERPPQNEKPGPSLLNLPDMDHLVNKMSLQAERGGTEIGAIAVRAGMEMDMSTRRHRYRAGLERKPAPPPDHHPVAINRRSEYRLDQRHLAAGQRSLTPGRTCRNRFAQCPPPE